MRILIIGGTRFIGPRVVSRLVKAGHAVTLFHRGNSLGADGTSADSQTAGLVAGCSQITGDRRALDEGTIERLRTTEPEAVIDMCCLNEGDARGMLDVFHGIARRYVLVSSCDVYRAYGILNGSEPGEPEIEPTPVTEDSPLRSKLYPYRGDEPRANDDPLKRLDDYDKIPAEQLVLGAGSLEGTVLRLPMVYGPGDYQRRLRDYAARMTADSSELKLPASLAAWRTCRGYVGNVAAAIALGATLLPAGGRVYNVAEQPAYTELQWARRVARALSWFGRIITVPDDELPEDQRPNFNTAQHLDVDSHRIRAELIYTEPVELIDALRQSLAWELRQQQLDAADEVDAAGTDG